jgi:hypothetical protein
VGSREKVAYNYGFYLAAKASSPNVLNSETHRF